MLLLAALLGLADAAVPGCTLPPDFAAPHIAASSDKEPRRLLPIGSYTLSLIWMPQECRAGGDGDCTLYRKSLGHGGRKDGFTLHGLWPDGEGKEWPQYCRPAKPLPAALIAPHLCATPSPQLIQHEWSKHGTCMAGFTPTRYFDLSTRLAARIRMPDLATMAATPQTAAGVTQAIASANPGMTAAMLRLYLDKQGWLREVWFCLDTAFQAQVCLPSQGGARGDEAVLIRTAG